MSTRYTTTFTTVHNRGDCLFFSHKHTVPAFAQPAGKPTAALKRNDFSRILMGNKTNRWKCRKRFRCRSTSTHAVQLEQPPRDAKLTANEKKLHVHWIILRAMDDCPSFDVSILTWGAKEAEEFQLHQPQQPRTKKNHRLTKSRQRGLGRWGQRLLSTR